MLEEKKGPHTQTALRSSERSQKELQYLNLKRAFLVQRYIDVSHKYSITV